MLPATNAWQASLNSPEAKCKRKRRHCKHVLWVRIPATRRQFITARRLTELTVFAAPVKAALQANLTFDVASVRVESTEAESNVVLTMPVLVGALLLLPSISRNIARCSYWQFAASINTQFPVSTNVANYITVER